MGKLIRNGIEYGGGNGTDIFEVTQAEYDALVQAGTLVHNALYVISDAPNLNPTASDIEYSSGVTVKQAIDNLVAIETFEIKNITAVNNTDYTETKDISKSGYTPIGIVQMKFSQNYSSRFHCSNASISGNTATIQFRANAESFSTSNLIITFVVLYVKS